MIDDVIKMYRHNKTGNVYIVLVDNAIECTNGREDKQYIVYKNKFGQIFVREAAEFYQKFTAI